MMTAHRLDGWKAIAAHMHLSVRQCQRLAHSAGLPIHHRGSTRAVYADRRELERWIRDGEGGEATDDSGSAGGVDPGPEVRATTVDPTGPAERTEPQSIDPRLSLGRRPLVLLVAAVVLGIVVGGFGWVGFQWWWRSSLRSSVVSGSWSRAVGGWSGHGRGGLLNTGVMVGPGTEIVVTLCPRVSDWAGGVEIAQDRFHRTLIAYSPQGRKLNILKLPSGVLTVLPLKPEQTTRKAVLLRVAVNDGFLELGLDGIASELRLEAHDVDLGRLLLAVGRYGTEFLPSLAGSCSFRNLRVTGEWLGDEDPWSMPVVPPEQRVQTDYRVTLDNTDDQVDLLLDGRRVLTSTFGEPVNSFNLGPFLRPGEHVLTARVFNRKWTTTYGVRLSADGRTAWEERCGQVNVAGAECAELGSRTGLVRTLEFDLQAE